METVLQTVMARYKVQPVGNGTIDCIVQRRDVAGFLHAAYALGWRVTGLPWWCHVEEGTSGCPHGMGGPKSLYYAGWFSEMPWPMVEPTTIDAVLAYLQDPQDTDVLPCMVPWLWLEKAGSTTQS